MALVEFPQTRRHVRASAGSRAASAVIIAAEIPAWTALSVARTAAHHSAGMLSRRHHLLIASAPGFSPDAARSSAMPLRVDQSSMMERNVCGVFDIESCLGQFGLNGKANVADDYERPVSDNAAMAGRTSETEEKLAFIARVKAARMARFDTQKPMLTILGVEQGVYKHYETRSALPSRFIPKFCAATGVTMEWLLTGEGKGPAVAEIPKQVPRRMGRAARGRAA